MTPPPNPDTNPMWIRVGITIAALITVITAAWAIAVLVYVW